jgi:Domain of unknown function (DUF5076)
VKRELYQPPEITGDDRAMEMIRVWIAHNHLHVSMLSGMWEDAEESQVDERDAWDELLADLPTHIANGMMKEYGWDYDSIRDRIRAALLQHLDDKIENDRGGFCGIRGVRCCANA